jgi:hypothetical protein
MNNYKVIIAETNTGFLEPVAVEYEWVGKVCRPTKHAEGFLKGYRAWKNVTEAVKYNLDLQDNIRACIRMVSIRLLRIANYAIL